MWIKALAKSLMIVVGVYAIIIGVQQLFGCASLTVMAASDDGAMSWVFLLAWIPPGILILMGLRLIYRPPNRIMALIREEADESQARMIPTRVVLHTVSIFLGVLLLFWATSQLIQIAYMFSVTTSLERAEVLNPLWPNIGYFVVYAVGGIYFLLGAPHFVRWQLRKLEGLKQQTS